MLLCRLSCRATWIAQQTGKCAMSSVSSPTRPPSVLSIQSHVVFGHAGNSAAVFPMRRLGVDAWPLNTVQFSNHTQYTEGWKGSAFPAEELTDIVSGIAAIGKLPHCDAVLSGYVGHETQGGCILDIARSVKAQNSEALYCLDPVMGHPTKGCIVPDGVQDFFRDEAVAVADIVCPNVLELETLAGIGSRLDDLNSVVAAAEDILARGPKIVFVKHLSYAGVSPDCFEMLLVTSGGGGWKKGAWHISTPLLPLERPPVGVGDITSSMFLAHLLLGQDPVKALELTTGAYYGVLNTTLALREYELQLVAAQDEIVGPSQRFVAQEL